MANLIITIISIALVAVATAMGIYYGGSAYENATAQAAANQMISDAQQIAGAYQLYSNANGGALGPLNADLNLARNQGLILYGKFSIFGFLQLGQYLSTQSSIPGIVNNGDGGYDGNPTAYLCSATSYDLRAATFCSNIATQPIVVSYPMYGNAANSYATATKVQLQVCQDIANQARGQGAPIDTTYFIDYSTSQFDCAAEDPSNGGTAGEYDFVYRIL